MTSIGDEQEQGLSSSSFLDVGVLMGGKDASLAAVVDEVIQLRTSMWVADAERDAALADSVRQMQERCGNHLRKLIGELQGLRSLSAKLVAAKPKLGALSKTESSARFA